MSRTLLCFVSVDVGLVALDVLRLPICAVTCRKPAAHRQRQKADNGTFIFSGCGSALSAVNVICINFPVPWPPGEFSGNEASGSARVRCLSCRLPIPNDACAFGVRVRLLNVPMLTRALLSASGDPIFHLKDWGWE